MTALITDRTKTDVYLGNPKGRYGAEDLNRVERGVEYLLVLMKKLDIHMVLTTKTDWGLPERFDAQQWPTATQMARYLDNVACLCDAVGVVCDLPASMEHLTWEGANNIEKALLAVEGRITAVMQAFTYSGELFAGQEEGL